MFIVADLVSLINSMFQINQEWRELRCFLKHNNHPLLLLSPVKVEEIKKDPYFVMFHKFFTDREIDKIKDLAKPRVFNHVLPFVNWKHLNVLFYCSLTVKAATLILFYGRGSAISSAKEGKSVLFIIW